MSQVLLSSACSYLVCQEKSKVQAHDKPKNNAWAWARAYGKAKKLELGLAWLINQTKLKLKLKSSFWAWEIRNYITKCLNLLRRRKIVYSFYHASNPTYD